MNKNQLSHRMQYWNQLEPDNLIQAFLLHPPQDFTAWKSVSGVPVFKTAFDLLTTVDKPLRQKIVCLPLFRFWKKWLVKETCFVGTTVSEYALFPTNESLTADLFVQKLKETLYRDTPLLIVKDIPNNSPLLPNQANQFAKETSEAFKQSGFIQVEGQALAWVPVDYSSIDDYLSRFSKARRKDIRRKLKKQQELDITTYSCGDPFFNNESVLKKFYQLYLNVYWQSEIHFDLLSYKFFCFILQDQISQGVVFSYYQEDRLIGFNICFIVDDKLVDKYVGFDYPKAREYNLYYISWFYNLEYAMQHKLKQFIAGWTDPEIKAYLGAQFTFTQHAVYVRNPILRILLRSISSIFENDTQWQKTHPKKNNSLK